MPPAARQTDKVLHDTPHCHAPIHPAAPVPTPVAHPPIPRQIVSATQPTIKIVGQCAATVTSISEQCMLPSCVPGGPSVVAKGSGTVMMTGFPAARMGDEVAWPACVAPIGSPKGKIIPPCAPTVIIGG